jgi:PAS domain S-box-containing protein
VKGFQTRLFGRRLGLAWAVLVAGLLLVMLVWGALQAQKSRSAEQEFELHVREVTAAIQKRLRDHEQILLGGAGLFDASHSVSRQEWRTYVERLRLKENYPGILGVGYSQVIPPDQLGAHIASIRAEGFPDYRVKPAGERGLYTAIIYLEPFTGRNLAAFGYDMLSQETRRAAMQVAVENNATTISGKVRLVQETHGKEQAGFLMYVPVYRSGLPLNTSEERWQALMGFVYSPYRVEDLMQGILGHSNLLVDFTIHDGEEVTPVSLMYASADAHPIEAHATQLQIASRQIRAFGHAWTITLFSRPSFEARFATPLDWLVPSLGIGISLSLFALTWSLLSRREQALALASVMAEKREESEERFHQLFLHMGQGVVVHQADGRITQANPAAERILGLTLEQMKGSSSMDPRWRTILEDGSDFPGEEHPAMVALREGREVTGVVMGVWHPREETWRWIRVDAYPKHDPASGQAQEVYVVFSDITTQQAANLEVRQARKLLSDVLAAASEVSIIATAPTGIITVFNRGAEHLLGYKAEEMVGKQTPATIHLPGEIVARGGELSAELGKDVQGFRVFVEKPERAGSEQREWTYVRKDGSHVPVSLVVTAMRADSGEITGYLGIAQDISERKRSAAELTRLSLVASQTTNGVVITNAEGYVEWVNEGFVRLTGYTQNEVLGRKPGELLQGPGTDPKTVQEIRGALRQGVPFHAELINYTKAHKPYWVEISCNPLRDAEGTLQGFMAIESDITERKAADELLKLGREQLKEAQRIARLGSWTLDLRSSYLEWSDEIFRIFELDPTRFDASYDAFLDAVHPEDREMVNKAYTDSLADHQPYAITHRLLFKDGRVKYVEERCETLYDAEGRPMLSRGTVQDITAAMEADIAFKGQAEQTQAILDNVLDGIITIDAKGTISSFNKSAERIFGYAAMEVVGRNVSMLMPEPHRTQHDGYLHNYLTTRQARVIGIGREVEGRRKRGDTFPMELAVSEIQSQGKTLFIGVVRDITERKRVERMKDEFVSTVSHELRTPLTSIAGSLKLMAGDAVGMLPDTAKPLMHIALRNSERLTLLINDLLDMEKIAAGKLRFDMQLQPLMPLVEQALEANKAYGEQFQVQFALTHRVEDVYVRVDAQRMLQVLANYMSNAAKFSPENSRVQVSVVRLDGMVRVAVKDQGPGVPDEFRERIFQKFSQADSSDTRQTGGTGLGLAITKELAERMEGQVGFESVPGEGAAFYLDLPVVSVEETGPHLADSVQGV